MMDEMKQLQTKVVEAWNKEFKLEPLHTMV